MLSIEKLTKIYPGGHQSLKGVDLAAEEGVLGLLGPNGAGKSSLMEILAAQLAFERGKVTLDDRLNLLRHPQKWRRRLGYLPQSFDFPAHTSAREVLLEAGMLLGLRHQELKSRAGELLERVNLAQDARRQAAQFSRGMKQRLGLAMTLLHRPRLLLLDEPTAGLDPVERVLLRQLLAEVSQDAIVILSTHIVADVERCCSRVAVLVEGELLHDGTAGELAQQAQGQAWEHGANREEVDALLAQEGIVRVSVGEDQATVRRLAAEKPRENAEAVPPTLEDGYLLLLNKAGLSPLATAS